MAWLSPAFLISQHPAGDPPTTGCQAPRLQARKEEGWPPTYPSAGAWGASSSEGSHHTHVPELALLAPWPEARYRPPWSATHSAMGIIRAMNTKWALNSTGWCGSRWPRGTGASHRPCPTHSSSAVYKNFISVNHSDNFLSFVENKITQVYGVSRNLFPC